MLSIEIVRSEAPVCWNDRIDRASWGSALQTTNWAYLARALRGTEPFFLTAKKDGRHVAQCLLLKEGRYSDRIRRTFLKPFLSFFLSRWPVLSWAHGPVLLGERADIELIDPIAARIEELAVSERIVSIDFTPHPLMGGERLWESWKKAGYTERKVATYLVELTENFERKFHRSVRKNIKKCSTMGIDVDLVSKEEFPDYYHMLDAFRRRLSLPRESLDSYFQHIRFWEDRRLHFAAKINGEIIAGLGALVCNKLLIEVEAGDSSLCRSRGIPANDLLRFEIMRWGRERGFEYYDLAGVAVEPRTAKEKGIRRFKSKFGGEYVEFSTFHRKMRRSF